MSQEISQLLRTAKVQVAPETFTLISLRHDAWQRILEDPALSPRMKSPFMIFMDRHETTLILDAIDFETMRHAIRDSKTQGGFRLLTFDIELDLSVVGFLAHVSRIFADANVPVLALSAYSRDHLLIRQPDLAKALSALKGHVDEIC